MCTELSLNCTWGDTNSNFLLFTACNDLVDTLWHPQTLFMQITSIVHSILVVINDYWQWLWVIIVNCLLVATDNKHCDYDQSVILMCSLRVKHHVCGVSRSCRRCLDRFMWLFHHFSRFYDPKWSKMSTSTSIMAVDNIHVLQSVWLLCVHYGLSVTSGAFIDHVEDV